MATISCLLCSDLGKAAVDALCERVPFEEYELIGLSQHETRHHIARRKDVPRHRRGPEWDVAFSHGSWLYPISKRSSWEVLRWRFGPGETHAAWEALAARGVIPMAWADGSRPPRFFEPRDRTCHCGDGEEEHRLVPGHGFVQYGTDDDLLEAAPRSRELMLAMAAHPAWVETAEAVARELYGVPAVRWCYGLDTPRGGHRGARRKPHVSAFHALMDLGLRTVEIRDAGPSGFVVLEPEYPLMGPTARKLDIFLQGNRFLRGARRRREKTT